MADGADGPADACSCCVCFEAVKNPRKKTLPCGHVLHKRCALRWLCRSRSCPMCRRPVPRDPSWILRRAFRRLNLPRFAVHLPAVVRKELEHHPNLDQVVTYAFLTVDSADLLRVLRAIGL